MTQLTDRSVVRSRFLVDGEPLIIDMLRSPTIDDVLITEAHLYAASLDRDDKTLTEGREVPWEIKDYLIRLGVER